MPAEVERCVQALLAEGYSEDSAWAICTAEYERRHKKEDIDSNINAE